MTLNLIEMLKTSKYTPNHTKNTKTHFTIFKMFKNKTNGVQYFSQKQSSNQSTSYACFNGIIYIVEGHTA